METGSHGTAHTTTQSSETWTSKAVIGKAAFAARFSRFLSASVGLQQHILVSKVISAPQSPVAKKLRQGLKP